MRMSDTLFRVYEPFECGADGYPLVWHALPGAHAGGRAGVKDVVRADAGDRCERCKHPYKLGGGEWGESASPAKGAGSIENLGQGVLALVEFMVEQEQPVNADLPTLWSDCDRACRHLGPLRWRAPASAEKGRTWLSAPDDVPVVSYIENGHLVQAAWRILTVHHLNGRKEDLRWHNLVALCQRCHLAIQRKVVMEQVFPYEHSEWFRPYAAAFYAYSYLGEELSREETMGRLDELLALERAA